MIYLQNTTEPQFVHVPKTQTLSADTYELVLVDTADNGTLTLDCETVGVNSEYYAVIVSLPEGTKAGEYIYRLVEGSAPYTVMTEGLARVEEGGTHEIKVYEGEHNNIKIYGE